MEAVVQSVGLDFSREYGDDPYYIKSLAVTDFVELLFWISVALVFPSDDLKKSTSEVGFY